MVRTYKNKVLHYVTTRLRSSRGAEVIGHREAAFRVLRTLRKNGYAAFLADHNTGRSEAFFLPFLGEEAAVNNGSRRPRRARQGAGLARFPHA